MLVTKPYHHTLMADRHTDRPAVFVPTIYEKEQPQIARWDYYVLTVDTREAELPDTEKLNALGQEGWILVGLLDERASGRGSHVYYYFTRQLHA